MSLLNLNKELVEKVQELKTELNKVTKVNLELTADNHEKNVFVSELIRKYSKLIELNNKYFRECRPICDGFFEELLADGPDGPLSSSRLSSSSLLSSFDCISPIRTGRNNATSSSNQTFNNISLIRSAPSDQDDDNNDDYEEIPILEDDIESNESYGGTNKEMSTILEETAESVTNLNSTIPRRILPFRKCMIHSIESSFNNSRRARNNGSRELSREVFGSESLIRELNNTRAAKTTPGENNESSKGSIDEVRQDLDCPTNITSFFGFAEHGDESPCHEFVDLLSSTHVYNTRSRSRELCRTQLDGTNLEYPTNTSEQTDPAYKTKLRSNQKTK